MTKETYENLRKRALARRSADLGLSRIPGRPVWGVIMEIGAKDGVTSVVATDDGVLSLLTSAGGAIHLTKDDWPCSAGTRLIGAAGDYLFQCSPAWAYPLPENGMTRFYLLTFDGVMTAEAPLAELASGRSPFSNLYYDGHDACFLARLVTENPDWRSHRPATGTGAGPEAEAGAEPPVGETEDAETPPVEAPGSDLLLRAAADDDVDEVATLLAQGHSLGPNAKGITPLMAAAHAGALEPLRLLLAAEAPVDSRDAQGYTALMLACNAGHDVCARLLLGAGADIQAGDHEGFTAIMFAAKNGHNKVVRLLMERGADPTATADAGLSAISLATQKGHTQTVSILLGKS